MHIRYLSLTNFRNYARLELTLPERPLLIYGANAQGKTSLLEAIYLLAAGSSPLATRDHELIRWQAEDEGLPYARVWAEVVHRARTQEIEIVIERKSLANGGERTRKTIRINRAPKRRVDLSGQLNVVIFMPQDVDLIAGSPAGRRRYLDDALCQVDSGYCTALDDYDAALRQRNAALRHLRDEGGNPAQLAPFEAILARQGVRVTNARRRLIAALSRRAGRIHQQLTGEIEWLRLDYQPSFDPSAPPNRDYQIGLRLSTLAEPPAAFDVEAVENGVENEAGAGIDEEELITAFRETLESKRREEIMRGMTTVGPHRDEMTFVAGSPIHGTHEVDLRTYGSRGQQRTAVLSLKLAELAWMRAVTNESPVLLLDEVLAELDASRRRYLLDQLESVEQGLLTATDLEMFSPDFRKRAVLWEVELGRLVNR